MINTYISFRPITFNEVYTGWTVGREKNYSNPYPQGDYHLMKAVTIILEIQRLYLGGLLNLDWRGQG